MYKLINNPLTNEPIAVFKSEVGCIPFDEANTDYQEYLKWVAEGNEPDPADE